MTWLGRLKAALADQPYHPPRPYEFAIDVLWNRYDADDVFIDPDGTIRFIRENENGVVLGRVWPNGTVIEQATNTITLEDFRNVKESLRQQKQEIDDAIAQQLNLNAIGDKKELDPSCQ